MSHSSCNQCFWFCLSWDNLFIICRKRYRKWALEKWTGSTMWCHNNIFTAGLWYFTGNTRQWYEKWEYYTLSLQLQSRSHLVCPEWGSAYDQGKYQQPLIRSAGFMNFCWTNHTLSFIEILQTNVPIAMWRKLFTLLITCLAKTFFKALSTRRRPSPNIAYICDDSMDVISQCSAMAVLWCPAAEQDTSPTLRSNFSWKLCTKRNIYLGILRKVIMKKVILIIVERWQQNFHAQLTNFV